MTTTSKTISASTYSVLMLRGANRGSRRDFPRGAQGVDYLQQIVESELLPSLRGLGFEV
jgi:hypothetical protein